MAVGRVAISAIAACWTLVVANQRAPLLLYRNRLAGKPLDRVRSRRGRSNRSAIGAQVRVFWNGQQQVQEVPAAAVSAHRTSAAALRARRDRMIISRVEIRWPSGITQTLDIAPRVDRNPQGEGAGD